MQSEKPKVSAPPPTKVKIKRTALGKPLRKRKRARADLPPSRIHLGPTIAVIDIGSNSVRLVVYEGLARHLTPIFNEKALCGLGRAVQTTGMLAQDAVDSALVALRRYRALCRSMNVGRTYAIATAACRDASNGEDFIAQAEKICGVEIEILSGAREAKLAALGVISGIHQPDGMVGDLGGGSLELIDVRGHRTQHGVTLPLGGLALQDISHSSVRRAERLVMAEVAKATQLKACRGRTFYAVGGTWRALARLHIFQNAYPLHVMHGYRLPAAEALAFARRVRRVSSGALRDISVVAEARRPLLAYAALVLEHIIRVAKPKDIVISTYGVREGLLFAELSQEDRRADSLVAAAQDLNYLRSRSPKQGVELVAWMDGFIRAAGLKETPQERRLRHAACLMADIGWRAHPDYRGEQALNVIANGNFGEVDHAGRAFIALSVYFRYAGSVEDKDMPEIALLLTAKELARARLLGTAFRVAQLISAAQPGILPATRFSTRGHQLVLHFSRKVADLAGERVMNRLKQLARQVGRSAVIVTE